MLSRYVRSESGAGLIEFAIVVPVLIFTLFGIIETGRWLAFGVRLSNAAHAGVQFAVQSISTSGDTTDIADAACNDSGFACTTTTPSGGTSLAADTMLISSNAYCSTKAAAGSCPYGNYYVQVTTSASFRPLLNYPFLPSSVPMSAQATQQVNNTL
jgi:Flp pilus assembly protein TadG